MRRLLRRLALYAFHLGFTKPVLGWVVGVRYRRRNLIPDGPCLVVSNHNSHLDAAVLLSLFPLRRLPRVHPVAAADYFGSSWLKRTMAMLFMNGIPFERRPVRGRDPLAPLADLLADGASLIFFPEGSRGEAGVVASFRPGVGRLVKKVPDLRVVPVFLSGPERIWPRGQYVPVPLSIDVNVGRPRTYPADRDARTIAELVRQDVLALAPPPAPVPGQRPASPTRVAVCCVDDSLRARTARRITARLGRHGPTLAIDDPATEGDADGIREATPPIPMGHSRTWLGVLAAVFRARRRTEGLTFAEIVERARIDEALEHGSTWRFVVGGGSALVDLAAEAEVGLGTPDEKGRHQLTQYLRGEKKIPLSLSPRFIRRAPAVWLVNALDLTRPPGPDILVHIVLPRSEPSSDPRPGVKPRPAGEADLQEARRRVGAVLRKRRKTTVIELDATETCPDDAARRVEALCAGPVDAPTEATRGT